MEIALRVLPWMVVFRLAFACWMFSNIFASGKLAKTALTSASDAALGSAAITQRLKSASFVAAGGWGGGGAAGLSPRAGPEAAKRQASRVAGSVGRVGITVVSGTGRRGSESQADGLLRQRLGMECHVGPPV